MIKDEDQLDFDLATHSNVRVFEPNKGKKSATAEPEAQESSEELLEKGLEIFAQELSGDARGFFAMIFDAENNPKILWAGNIDMIMALGSLELAKNELYNVAFAGSDGE